MSNEGYVIGFILAIAIPAAIELYFKNKKWKQGYFTVKIKNGLLKLVVAQIHSQTKILQLYLQSFTT